MRRCLLVPLLLAAVLHAAPILPQISGDNSTYDQAAQEMVVSGHAQLVYGPAVLTADEMRYSHTTETAIASGHVVLTRGPQRVLADQLSYRLSDGFFQVEHARLGEYPIYISADSAAGTKSQITFQNATVTLREPDPAAPTLHAATLVYEPGRRISAVHANLGVGSVRPIALPHFAQHIDEPLLSYVDTSAGYRSLLGGYLGAGLHIPVAPGVRLGGDAAFYSRRGILFGPSGTYTYADAGQELGGYFRSGYINDHGVRGTDILGRPVAANRGYFEWQHFQTIDPHVTVTADINYWSDSEILRDFRPREFYPLEQPDNFVEADYAGDNYVVSALGRFHPNNFYLVQERLPEVRFDLLPLAVSGGFYERASASAAALREDALLTGPTLHSNRYDAFYELARPFAPANWFTFTPVAGGRLTYYARALDGKDTYTRTLGEAGFDSELRTSGTWDYKNERWHIDGLRHLFTPQVSYRYIPQAAKGQPYIPPVDRDAFSPYLQPLDLGDMRNVDQLHRTNTLRLALDNILQTRDPQYGSRNLLHLNVADDLRLSRNPGDKAFSQVQTELNATPVNWLQLDALEIFSPQQGQHRELGTGLTIRDGGQRSFSFFNHFLRGQLEDYGFEYHEQINEAFEIVERLTYDARAGRFDQQVVDLVQNLRNTWRIHYEVALLNGDRREGHLGLNMEIELIKF
ncbi:MAG TPA: LPS assembly protein LptD [Opitutaceae bacterium]|nr:LPS assembly protein LptD [Opitutaceae bacterium]